MVMSRPAQPRGGLLGRHPLRLGGAELGELAGDLALDQPRDVLADLGSEVAENVLRASRILCPWERR